MSDTQPVKLEDEARDILGAMLTVEEMLAADTLDPGLRHLVRLRVSQANRCGYCVQMHTREARQHGESDPRLDRLTVWEQVGDYTEKERAALAWAEALTELPVRADLSPLRAALRQYFSEREIAVLTATVAMINMWNRIGVARH